MPPHLPDPPWPHEHPARERSPAKLTHIFKTCGNLRQPFRPQPRGISTAQALQQAQLNGKKSSVVRKTPTRHAAGSRHQDDAAE